MVPWNQKNPFWEPVYQYCMKVSNIVFFRGNSSKVKLLEILGKLNAKKGKILDIFYLKMPILVHKKSKRPHKTTWLLPPCRGSLEPTLLMFKICISLNFAERRYLPLKFGEIGKNFKTPSGIRTSTLRDTKKHFQALVDLATEASWNWKQCILRMAIYLASIHL